MKLRTTVIALTILAVATAPVAGTVGASTSQDGAYAGANVSFEAQSNAIVDYQLDGETVASSIKVQGSDDNSGLGNVGLGADVSAIASIAGAQISVQANTQAQTRMSTDSGARISAHDNERGVLVVDAGGSGQLVTANVSAGASAESDGENRVVVTRESGAQTSFILVGEGEVAVNDGGNVSAELGENARLVTRSYSGERDDADESQENMIANGTAAAEVYLTQSSEEGEGYVEDVVNYSSDTTVEVTQQSESAVNMTVERSQEEGRVVLTTVHREAVGSFEDLQVTVDGEAAAEANSYSEVESAAQGGDGPAFLVNQDTGAEATADVVVGIDHFSERQVQMQSDGSTGGAGPGFGVTAALIGALLSIGAARLRWD